MAVSAADLKAMIIEGFPDSDVTIVDLAGDGNHYKAIVHSAVFQGKSRVQQHQMVYASLNGKMGDGADKLHALALETKAK